MALTPLQHASPSPPPAPRRAAKRPQSLPRCSCAARHCSCAARQSAVRLSERHGARWKRLQQHACTPSLAARRSECRRLRVEMALMPLQHASPSPPPGRSVLPSGLKACLLALARPGSQQRGSASVPAQAQASSVAGVHAVLGGTAVSMPSATMSDCAHAAAARVSTAATDPQRAGKRPQSLPPCSCAARQSAARLSERAGSGSSVFISTRAHYPW